MNIKMFAAIDLGSFETCMSIYEFSDKGMKEIDHLRHRISLGSDSYNTGTISYKKIDELCKVLNKFRDIMKSYQVSAYKAYGTSALRETVNTMIIRDQIRNRTGFDVEVLSNSEQRFLDYKSLASKGEAFNNILEQGTAVVDIGGGNIQISLFENDTLVTTQNLRLGVLRIHERLEKMRIGKEHAREILDELIEEELSSFRKMFTKERDITNLIVVDDYVSRVVHLGLARGARDNFIVLEDYLAFITELYGKNADELATILEMPEEDIRLLRIASEIVKHLMIDLEAERIWAPGVTLCDGIAYEYAEKKKLKMTVHNFEKDILAAASVISKRYMGSRKRNEALEMVALSIFDSMKKVHGMGDRERMLLQLSVLLHDCGKFINITNVGDCSYSIILNTEMIGLSHEEREIVAYVVRFYYNNFIYFEELAKATTMQKDAYLTIAKLTAIMRVAGTLGRGQRQKVKRIKAALKDETLVIYIDEEQDILFEQESFRRSADFFGQVYSIEPTIVRKKLS